MKHKSMIILALTIFVLISIVGVSAAEANDTVIASEDTGEIELSSNSIETDGLKTSPEDTPLSQANNDEIINVENDVDVLGEGEYNYTQLKDQFRFDGDITLIAGNYTYVSGDGDTIKITTSRVIDGNGAVIDMANSGNRAFSVTTDGVTIKNLTIKNANFNGNGGAIYFSSSGTVENCNFTNNHAEYDGGAIRMSSGSVTNCNFTGNKATGSNSWGGAILFAGKGSVTNCNFINNTATNGNGGAIYFYYGSTGTVTNCNFTNNSARYGGAIYFEYGSTGNVTNCNFSGNTADGDGGAVYFNNYGNVTNCNFTNNKATGSNSWGGAVYMYSGSVTNCNFTDNEAYYSGAIRFDGEGNVTNCNFAGNNATGEGGAINMGSGSVSNCNFTDNSASTYGGAVYLDSNGEVTNCNFVDNSAWYGGAIRMYSGTVTNCNFTDNKATGDDSYGGAIRVNGEGTVTNCNFADNTATYEGGAVWIYSGTVTNCNFTGNNATTGSAIYFYSTSSTKTVSNSRFLNNRANAEVLEVTKNDNNITITFTGNDNLLNAIYSRNGAEVTFTNVTYWGANGITTVSATMSGSNKATGQNITVGVVVNNELVLSDVMVTDENGMIVLDISAGENYYISARHDADSYYTEAERTISNNINVNIISQTTTNKTVNITAKSNIKPEVMPGKLLFIVPNSNPINATYASNGTWWALHTFDDYGNYDINASYIGLDVVTINNATISIIGDAKVTAENITTTVNNETVIVATTTPENLNLTYLSADPNIATVDASGKVTGKSNGTTTITITINGEGKYYENTTTINVTVKLNDARVNAEPIAVNVSETNNITTTSEPEDLKVEYSSNDPSIATVDDTGRVTGVSEGETNITLTVGDDVIYAKYSVNVSVTVSKKTVTIDADTVEMTYGNNNTLTTTFRYNGKDVEAPVAVSVNNDARDNMTSTGGKITLNDLNRWRVGNYTVTLTVNTNEYKGNRTVNVKINKAQPDFKLENLAVNVTGSATVTPKDIVSDNNPKFTYQSMDESVVTVDATGAALGVSEGTANVTVTLKESENYTALSKNVSITVTKITTSINVANTTLSLTAGENTSAGARLTPEGAGKLTYTSSNNTVAYVENDMIISNCTGNAVITVTFKGDDTYADAENKTISVSVSPAPASLTAQDITLTVNGTSKINPVTDPAGLEVTYESLDPTIAEVDADGNVTGHKGGSTKIIIKNKADGKHAINSTQINVTVNKLTSEIKIENSKITLNVNNNQTAGASLIPETGKLTYTSSNDTVAVAENGIIIAKGEGTAVITVSYAGDDYYNAAENKTITVTVKLNDASISVYEDTLDLIIDAEGIIDAYTSPDGLNITYKSDNESVATVDTSGKVTAVSEGTATITLSIGGDGIYAPNSTTVTVNVGKITTEIIISNESVDLKALENRTAGATLIPDEDAGNLTYTSNNPSVAIVENGIIKALSKGNATITVSFNGNDKYEAAENRTITVTVGLNDALISPNNDTLDLFVDETFTIIAETVPSGLDVTYIPDDSGIVSVDENGKITALKEGTATITVKTGDNKVYAPNSTIVTVTVSKVKATANITVPSNITAGDESTVDIELPEDATGNVTVKDNGKTIATAQLTDGKAKISMSLKSGTHNLEISYTGDGKYAPSTENKTVTANKITTHILVDESFRRYSTDCKAGERGGNITAYLLDENNNPLSNMPVQFTVNGKTYNLITNDTGAFSLQINLKMPKTYTIALTYNGDDKYNATTATSKLVIVQKKTSIKASDKTFRAKAKTKTIQVTLKTVKNQFSGKTYIREGKKLTLVVKGKRYTKHTDAKGKAIFTVNLRVKGTFTAKITFEGDKIYTASTKKIKITIK